MAEDAGAANLFCFLPSAEVRPLWHPRYVRNTPAGPSFGAQVHPPAAAPIWVSLLEGGVLAELHMVQRVFSAPGLWPQMFP